MLNNRSCFWPVLLWSPVMSLPQLVKHDGPTVIVGIQGCVSNWCTQPNWANTHDTLLYTPLWIQAKSDRQLTWLATAMWSWADVSPKVESDSTFPAFIFLFFCGILHCLHRRSQNRLPSENRMGKPELSLQHQMLCKWSLTFRLAFCTFTLLPFVCLVFWCPFDEKQLKKKNLFYWKPKANSDMDIFCVCSSSWKSLHYVMITSTLCIVFLSLCMNLTHFTSTKFKIICLFHHIQMFSP